MWGDLGPKYDIQTLVRARGQPLTIQSQTGGYWNHSSRSWEPWEEGEPQRWHHSSGRNKATGSFPIWKLLTGSGQECQKIQRFPRDPFPHFHSEIHLRTCRARDTQHQNHWPTAVCQELAAPGPRQRGQQETVSSELAKVQRGNFLERHEDVTEQGSELLVGQGGTLARMNRTGDEEVSQVLYLSTVPSGSLCHLLILSHLPLCPVFLYLCIFCIFSFSPSPSDYLWEWLYLHSSVIRLSHLCSSLTVITSRHDAILCIALLVVCFLPLEVGFMKARIFVCVAFCCVPCAWNTAWFNKYLWNDNWMNCHSHLSEDINNQCHQYYFIITVKQHELLFVIVAIYWVQNIYQKLDQVL